ncbi:MAG: DUF721 domain-containing protein [Kineosporiaceae bacterium]|nr:DUF721 domain-containing protein [Aeromicrobium sp.]
MNEPPEPQSSEPESTSAPEQAAKADGLELARDIANGYRTSAPKQPRRAGRKPSTSRGVKRESRDDPEPLAQFLGKLIADQGWAENLSAQQVFTDWAAIVGEEVARHCIIAGYEDGQLEVEADSTAWATQLRLLAPRIVAKLNTRLGQGSVVRINISGPKGPSWIKGKRTIRNARGPRDTYG